MENHQNNPITATEIERDILTRFDIGMKPLSELLGWGANTISRFMNGETRLTTEYNNKLKTLVNPIEMKKLLLLNGDILSEVAKQKAITKVDLAIIDLLKQDFHGFAFVKRMNAHELGYRKGIPRKAGAFMLISKLTTSYFPSLSSNILNDNATLQIKIAASNEIVDVNYIYHNSKFATSDENESRDEYRMYLSHLSNTYPDDIIILLKAPSDFHYTWYQFSPSASNYVTLEKLIEKYRVGKSSSALIPLAELALNNIGIVDIYMPDLSEEEVLAEYEKPLFSSEITENEKISITVPSMKDLLFMDIRNTDIETIVTTSKKLKRDNRFRKIVLDNYGYKCAITGTSISYKQLTNIQAAHIIGKSYGGSDNPTNGIALNMDMHWAFDNGLFTILDDYTILVHDEVKDISLMNDLNGNSIILPKNTLGYPNKEALKYHRENIFGAFSKLK